jgi:hypothetical protein
VFLLFFHVAETGKESMWRIGGKREVDLNKETPGER